jgi:hypothetical protein
MSPNERFQPRSRFTGPRLKEERSNPDMKTTSMPGFNALTCGERAFLAIGK